ncbi:hypothetical protein A1232T_02326 [Psychrobacter piechaudii]|uniref:Uncharacterized protein n=1 Tax=Psychrobacter piechaudii TaxID=1945521 RepID=A0A1R4GY02_9GAMM|nr:hypothetical protein A1232T_02326 [Psychrobacter piechaudii]
MIDTIKHYMDITREELSVSKDQINVDLTDELLFGAVCYKYFYNDGKFDIIDFKNSYTDGSNDGGIDFIAVNEGDI